MTPLQARRPCISGMIFYSWNIPIAGDIAAADSSLKSLISPPESPSPTLWSSHLSPGGLPGYGQLNNCIYRIYLCGWQVNLQPAIGLTAVVHRLLVRFQPGTVHLQTWRKLQVQ